jgi:hypothetical protein
MLPYGVPIWTPYDKKLLSLIGTEERSGRMAGPTSDAPSPLFRNRDRVASVREIDGYGQENVRYSQQCR